MGRIVATNVDVPSGSSPENIGGISSQFARLDHLHGMWEPWKEIVPTPPFGQFSPAYPTIRITAGGSLRRIQGAVDNPAPNAFSADICTLEEVDRPKANLLFFCYARLSAGGAGFNVLEIRSDGLVRLLDNTLTPIADNVVSAHISGILYRVDV